MKQLGALVGVLVVAVQVASADAPPPIVTPSPVGPRAIVRIASVSDYVPQMPWATKPPAPLAPTPTGPPTPAPPTTYDTPWAQPIRIPAEVLAGSGLGLAGAVSGFAFGAGFCLTSCSSATIVAPTALGFLAGTTLGVWTVGRTARYDASFSMTVFGTLLGASLGAFAAVPLASHHPRLAATIVAGTTVLGGPTWYELVGAPRAHTAPRLVPVANPSYLGLAMTGSLP